MIGFLAFALPCILFVRFPSTLWNFDGVACAAAVELGQPAYLFHANHLAYGFLGFLFWKIVGLPLGLSRALPALQLFSSLLSAAGLIGLYRLLGYVLKNKIMALLLTFSMALTAAFWVWSVEAQVYPLGFLPLAWAAYFLVAGQSRYKYVWVGLLHGAAILGHQMHALWIIPALYWMKQDKNSSPLALYQYLTPLALITVVPYLLVLGFVIAPGRDLGHILIWLKGSAGLTPNRDWAWHFPGWNGPWIWIKSTAPALWGSFWPYGKTMLPPWIWVLTAVSAATFLILLIRGSALPSEKLARFSGLWLGVYGLFLSTWEPETLCYRMTDIIPLGILLALGLQSMRRRLQALLISLLLVSMLTINWFSQIRPMHQSERNSIYQDTLNLSKTTSPNSLYITGGGIPWIYILYFTGRSAWNTRAFTAAQLENELNRQKRARPVYIQSLLLRDPKVLESLKTQKLQQVEEGSSWLQVR